MTDYIVYEFYQHVTLFIGRDDFNKWFELLLLIDINKLQEI